MTGDCPKFLSRAGLLFLKNKNLILSGRSVGTGISVRERHAGCPVRRGGCVCLGGAGGASAGASAEKQTADSEPTGVPDYFAQTGCDLAEREG